MSKYKELKDKLDNYLKRGFFTLVDIKNIVELSREMLSTIKELEPVEIDSEFFDWQKKKYRLTSGIARYIYKEKSDGTKAKVGEAYYDNEVIFYKPKKLITPDNQGCNWSTYWLMTDNMNRYIRFQPSNRINEVFEDPWSIYEFNSLGYKTPNGTIIHWDSYLD